MFSYTIIKKPTVNTFLVFDFDCGYLHGNMAKSALPLQLREIKRNRLHIHDHCCKAVFLGQLHVYVNSNELKLKRAKKKQLVASFLIQSSSQRQWLPSMKWELAWKLLKVKIMRTRVCRKFTQLIPENGNAQRQFFKWKQNFGNMIKTHYVNDSVRFGQTQWERLNAFCAYFFDCFYEWQ